MAVDMLEIFLPIVGLGIGLAVAVGILLYVYFALAIQTIAQKVKTKEPAWLAWIPIVNLYLIVRIAGWPGWYLLGFFLGVIPFVGWILGIAFNIWAWWRVADARKFPGWMGILMLIPLVNLVTIGILAWGNPSKR